MGLKPEFFCLFDNSRDRWSTKALLARVGRRSVQRTVPTLRQQRCVLPGSPNALQGQHTRKQSFRTPNHGEYQRANIRRHVVRYYTEFSDLEKLNIGCITY